MHLTVIQAKQRFSVSSLFAEYREATTLLRHLTQRDLRLRFQNPLLGLLWVTLQPVLPALVFAFIFARLLQPSTAGVPYALFALAGFVLWSFFSTSVSTASMVFVWNANLLNKVYFPRAVLPASAMVASSVELAAGVVLLCAYSVHRGYPPRLTWLWILPVALEVVVIAFFVALGLATANALNRNVKFAIPFLMQLWIYASPVVYPASLLPQTSRYWLALNPLTGPLEALRAAIFATPVAFPLLLLSSASSLVVVAASVVLFRRFEASLAEKA